MKRASRAHLPARVPCLLPSSSELPPPRGSRPLRRRLRNPAFPGRRWGGAAAAAGGRRSGPTTPLLRWKFEDAELSGKPKPKPRPAARSEHGGGKAGRNARVAGAAAGAGASGPVSVRKLAAGIWQLQLPEFSVPVKSVAARVSF